MQKEYYSLHTMWLRARKGDPGYQTLWNWHDGIIGETSAVNRLKRIGMIPHDHVEAGTDIDWATVQQVAKAYRARTSYKRTPITINYKGVTE